MWEFATGNTFGALAFTSYGAFWISFACIFIPFFNVAGAYTNPDELFAALGHYLICIVFEASSDCRLVHVHRFLDCRDASIVCGLLRSLLHPNNGILNAGDRILSR